jgi:epoxyqueuosine reductase QueG
MKALLHREIERWIREDQGSGGPAPAGPFYDAHRVGIAAASDPLFASFKSVVGPLHLTPEEAFALAHPDTDREARSVVSVALAIAAPIRQANARARGQSAPEWTLLRSYGDGGVLPRLGEHLVGFLNQHGHRAAAPSRLPAFRIARDPAGFSSSWSERHVAFAAGLGTFSANDGFITEMGMAIRLVSLVTDAVLEPDPRPDRGIYGNCLIRNGRKCGACFRRCPVGALSPNGHDKTLCHQQCYGEAARALAAERGGMPALGSGCGLCQTGVPCEARNPMG